MKIINTLIAFILLLISQTLLSQVPKKMVVEHFTNSNCGTCASRNPGFYTNLNNHPGTLHLAVHPSAPYQSCLLYQQNATDNNARTNYYGIFGSTPRIVVNGNVVSAATNYSSASIFTNYLSQTSPASIRIVQNKFGNDSIQATVIIKTEALNSLGSLSFFVALAEDTVFHTGTNGEQRHFDVFRKSLSNTTGTSVTLPSSVGDSVVLTFSSPSNSIWNFSRIYTLAILQETTSKNLVQAEAASVADGLILTDIREPSPTINATIFPNPVSQAIDIRLEEDLPSTVQLFNLEGELLLQQSLFKKELTLDLLEFPNTTYLLRISNSKGVYVQKIVKQ